MNARIRELALQCNAWCQVYDNKRFMVDGNFDVEQFAELIIQECGVALSPMLRDMISRGQAHELIRKHFGVES